MEQLETIAGDFPLYLTGDFNCAADSLAYDVVEETLQDAHKTTWKDNSTVWGTYHNYQVYGWEIDFIFYSRSATPVNYEIISKQYDGYVSDHYGVIAEFVY
jgi:endonuclease/exonuclease/phosphatase family metal-dependent hydrolase